MPIPNNLVINEPNGEYFCLELSGQEQLEDLNTFFSSLATSSITQLDVHFKKTARTAELIARYLSLVSGHLKGTQVERFDISCNDLFLIGEEALTGILRTVPSTISVVLSGNNFHLLKISAKALTQTLYSATEASLIFEDSSEFELDIVAALKKMQAPKEINRHMMFANKAQEAKEEVAQTESQRPKEGDESRLEF